ncbi:alpha/beta fold hydrolase [Legionella bozemanae]|uniref:Lipolytic protein n=1 Tax=Legionella bozemanae TaxID=447 RepID=A0A0W0RWG3_LEGBO|nr:alpha/beta hydrolase [Legionella bozemanae]KTC75404.1 lipolytic protein [Legionella bozemanae]STO34249.1 Pimelyl-[acyl-carrier protein] methyl ester esterase [Legionella bozemanae]
MKHNLIIIPGWGGTELLWKHQSEHLADIADITVKYFPDAETIEKMTEQLLKDAPEKFIICGHSLGGWVAQLAAIKAPHRVSHLIIMGSWTGDLNQEKRQYFEQWQHEIENDRLEHLLSEVNATSVLPSRSKDRSLMSTLVEGQAKFPRQGFLNQTKAMLNSQPTTLQLHKIECPTLIIYGRQDSAFTLETQQSLKSGIPSAKLAIIEDCGHMCHVEQPQAVTALLKFWLEDHLK